jgi:hypothetical protein
VQFLAIAEHDQVLPRSAHRDVDEIPFALQPRDSARVRVDGQHRREQDRFALSPLEGMGGAHTHILECPTIILRNQ